RDRHQGGRQDRDTREEPALLDRFTPLEPAVDERAEQLDDGVQAQCEETAALTKRSGQGVARHDVVFFAARLAGACLAGVLLAEVFWIVGAFAPLVFVSVRFVGARRVAVVVAVAARRGLSSVEAGGAVEVAAAL